MPIVIKDNRKTFGLGSILLHWITALIIIGMYPLGLYIGTLTYYDADYHTVPYWHKSIGMILLGLVVLRVLWRIANTSPAPPATTTASVISDQSGTPAAVSANTDCAGVRLYDLDRRWSGDRGIQLV